MKKAAPATATVMSEDEESEDAVDEDEAEEGDDKIEVECSAWLQTRFSDILQRILSFSCCHDFIFVAMIVVDYILQLINFSLFLCFFLFKYIGNGSSP